tara:strand:- start:15 stop:929 length:915 start_codon:yes stop_codon:yes gene_type:complete
MHVFGEIDKSETIVESKVVNFTQNLSSSATGIQSIKIISGSTNTNHWNSLNVLFYTSGSTVYSHESLKFSKPSSNLSIQRREGEQFLTKYHSYDSSSLITIPSQYYGERIKEGSFKLTDLNNTDNGGINPLIIDDGFGNLYATNANSNFGTLTASSAGVNNSISSSENYVGNIFYDKGIAIITETGSWSGSVNYSDLATNFNLKFESIDTIYSHEYNVVLLPNTYNYSTNYTLRNVLSGSSNAVDLSTPFLASTYTGSDFQPYITTINLYQEGDYQEPLIQATLPKPIRKSDKVNLRFKIKLDL